jgi:hypothetical protein
MVDSTLLKTSSKKKSIQPSEKTIAHILRFSASLKNVGSTKIGEVVVGQN